MTDTQKRGKSHEDRLQDVEALLASISGRLEGHAKHVIHDLLPEIEALRTMVESLWISDDRFKALEQAVATLARDLYEGRSGRPIDSRSRPYRPFKPNVRPS